MRLGRTASLRAAKRQEREFLERRAVVEIGFQSDFAKLAGDVVGGQIESFAAQPAAFQFVGR